jgi:pantoate--beta-alanine ligase
MPIPVVHTVAELRNTLAQARSAERTVGFVPTMGALHAGHAELIRTADRLATFVVVSVFVNPTQFGPKEDYGKYPRTLEQDALLSKEAGADLIFAPSAEEMYPPDSVTFVEVPGLDEVLCGPRRPGHFRGVCTVVLKLFNMVQPEIAVFGAKDAQQAIILLKMVKDLNVPVQMVIAPTVREPDGLAMSSRNRYLSAEEREHAPKIYAELQKIEARIKAGESDVGRLESALVAGLEVIPGARVDYANVVESENLKPIQRISGPVLVAVAVFMGTTRLIDNVMVG